MATVLLVGVVAVTTALALRAAVVYPEEEVERLLMARKVADWGLHLVETCLDGA